MFRPGKHVTVARVAGLISASALALMGCVHPGFDHGSQQSAESGRGAAPGASSGSSAQAPWALIGRPATLAEVAAWDIDVRADFKGLPKGSGSVDKGMEVWDAKCASCHGTFGESNEVFTPVVGGTSKQDITTGRVANLSRADFPQRTTLMKVSQLSTLWDYINRAMPWNAPKSLSVEEVYAVTAYILHLGDIVPADFVLSDTNMSQTQARLPNRNGAVRFDGLWSVRGKPDIQATACMKDCPVDKGIDSILPDYARNAHGQIAAQNRVVGPVRGADTSQPASSKASLLALAAAETSMKERPAGERDTAALARESGCLACHATEGKLVGPGWREIAARYKDRPDALAMLTTKVQAGGQGAWGPIPMPAQPQLSAADSQGLVRWILAGSHE